jgi:hypothetical protein
VKDSLFFFTDRELGDFDLSLRLFAKLDELKLLLLGTTTYL